MPAAASVWLCQTGTHARCCAVARKKGSTDAIIAACDEVSATSQSAEPVEARLGEQVAKVLSDFCATIRKEAVSGHIAVLDACDYVRDDALTEIGVPKGEIPLALLSFNLGIEFGQLSFIALVLIAAGLWNRIGPRLQPEALGLRVRARTVAGYAIGSVAAYWLFERLNGVAGSAAFFGWTST